MSVENGFPTRETGNKQSIYALRDEHAPFQRGNLGNLLTCPELVSTLLQICKSEGKRYNGDSEARGCLSHREAITVDCFAELQVRVPDYLAVDGTFT